MDLGTARQKERREAWMTPAGLFDVLTGNIKEVFWITNVEKSEMFYISPGYESIWGRSCQSLYENPRSWLDAIDPRDRERVLAAALKQQSGVYDEQYRIVRPDGSLRWIRDRGFPVHDASGTVDRIAGVADDITEQRKLEEQLLEISDREQARIGHDLHDDLCQFLIGILFHCHDLAAALRAAKSPEAARAGEIAEHINTAITQARQLARGLFPVLLEQEGLVPALEEFATGVKSRFKTECSVQCDAPVQIGQRFVSNQLYRIVQEAVNNAGKHAQARRIVIQIGKSDIALDLSITDDGVGMPASSGGEGMGMHIMNYRAHAIGGTLEIKSSPGAGTSIICRVPLEKLNLEL